MVPIGVGAHNKIRARMFGLLWSVESAVRTWVPGELMVIESIKPARPAKGIATHRFERHREGTRYTWTMEFVPTVLLGGIPARLLAGGFRRAVRRQSRFRGLMAERSNLAYRPLDPLAIEAESRAVRQVFAERTATTTSR